MEDIKEKTLEQNFTELDGIIEKMQSEDLSLEETFNLYKSGVSLVENCNNSIEKIRCEIRKISPDAGV